MFLSGTAVQAEPRSSQGLNFNTGRRKQGKQIRLQNLYSFVFAMWKTSCGVERLHEEIKAACLPAGFCLLAQLLCSCLASYSEAVTALNSS